MNDVDYNKQMRDRTFAWLLAGIFVAALTIRLGLTVGFVGLSSPPDLSASPDQGEYNTILQQMIAGQGYAKAPGEPTARRAPGLVFTVLPVYAATGGSYAATRALIILMSAGTCVLVGLLTANVFNRWAGIIAAVGLAVYPGHAYYAMHLLSEGPFGFYLALACLLTFVAMRSQQLRWFAVAGLVWGATVLTKPQFVLLGPLAGLAVLGWTVWAICRWRAFNWQPLAGVTVCVLMGSSLVAPWIVRNAVVLDSPGLSTIGGYGLWSGNNEIGYNDPAWRGRGMPTSQIEAAMGVKLPEGEAASDTQAKAYGKQFIAEHRADMPTLVAWKLYRLVTPFQPSENRPMYWAEAVSWIILAPLLVAGWWLGRRQQPAQLLVLLGPVVITLAVTAVYLAIIRYRNALLPVMMPFAALSVQVLWLWMRAKLRPADAAPLASLGQDQEQPARQAA